MTLLVFIYLLCIAKFQRPQRFESHRTNPIDVNSIVILNVRAYFIIHGRDVVQSILSQFCQEFDCTEHVIIRTANILYSLLIKQVNE